MNLSQCKQVKSSQLLGIFTNSMLKLKYLNLAYIDDVNDDAFIAASAPQIPAVVHFAGSISGTDSALFFTEESSAELTDNSAAIGDVHKNQSFIVCTSKLETLNLCKSRITDHSISSMLRYIPTLLSLSIPYCAHITDVGIGVLVTSCPLLQTLDMKSCDHITDQSLTSIGQRCVNLTSLDISWCHAISNIGLHNLILPSFGSQIMQLKELKVLWCRELTTALLESWCEELPVDKLKKIYCQGCAFMVSEVTNSIGQTDHTVTDEPPRMSPNFDTGDSGNNFLTDRHKLIQILKYEKGLEVIL